VCLGPIVSYFDSAITAWPLHKASDCNMCVSPAEVRPIFPRRDPKHASSVGT